MRFLKCLCYWLNKCCAFSTCSSMNYPKHTCQNKCVYKYRLATIKSSKVVWVLSQLTNVSLFIPALMNPFSSSALNKSNVSLDGYHSDFLIRRAGIWLRYFAILLSKGMLFFSMLMTSLFFHSHVLKDSTMVTACIIYQFFLLSFSCAPLENIEVWLWQLEKLTNSLTEKVFWKSDLGNKQKFHMEFHQIIHSLQTDTFWRMFM